MELTATSLWELKWRITAHPDKTKVTYFNARREAPRQTYLYPFLPAATPIPRTNTNKVLGLLFDENLTFHNQIASKSAQALNTHYKLFRFRNCDTKTKLHLYKALVQPPHYVLPTSPLSDSTNQRTKTTNHSK